ncbi:MAG: sulfite exporter TauE/SafE family protein [Promethearchaeota archaeon]
MPITPLIVVIGVALGFLVGIFAALSGTGGGSLNVPILESLFCLPINIAQGTSSMVIFINSWSTNHAYYKQRRVDYKTGLILVLFSAGMSVVGALASSAIAGMEHSAFSGKSFLKLIFYGFIAIIALRMLVKSKNGGRITDEQKITACNDGWIIPRTVVDCDQQKFEHHIYLKKVIPLSILAGFLSGFFGIGGGLVQVPMLHQACGMSIHVTVATSAFMIFFNSFLGFLTRGFRNEIDYTVGLIFAFGSVIGAQIGARIAKKTSIPGLKKIISGILIVLSVYKIITGIIDVL